MLTPCHRMTANICNTFRDKLRHSVHNFSFNAAYIGYYTSLFTTFQWLRAYYILGDDKRNHSIFTKILEAEERGDATFPVTTGKNAFDFIEVDELAYQIALAITQTEVTGIINTCTGKSTTLREKVEEFIATRHLKIKPQFGVFPDRPYDSPIIYGDNTKIQKILSAAG